MLNKDQLDAVSRTEGPVIILAGPGTGKTWTLTRKIAFLIKEKNISPENILAVTFTRSAANEIRERLKSILKDLIPEKEIKNISISTFHSIAFEILKIEKYPFKSPFRIIEKEEKRRLLENIVSPKEMTGLLEEIKCSKQKLSIPETADAREYQRKLAEKNLVDFEDLFIYVLQLFKEKPEILNKYKNCFRYVLVDEFQDTGFAQYEFMKILANENICVIGDPDQSIYGFINNFFKSV
jgi:DNA helicase-2/ATP-dependent DNA helicase PcrA